MHMYPTTFQTESIGSIGLMTCYIGRQLNGA